MHPGGSAVPEYRPDPLVKLLNLVLNLVPRGGRCKFTYSSSVLGGFVSGRDTQSNAVGTMDAVLQARISRDPELSCAGPRPSGPRTSTAKELQKQQRIHSNKRSAIIKEIQQNIKCEKSGLVPCYNYFIVFCEKLELNPRDASTLHHFRKEALDCFIEYGSKHPKSTYKYSMPTLTTSQGRPTGFMYLRVVPT